MSEIKHKFNPAQIAWLRETAQAVRLHPNTVAMGAWLVHEDGDEPKEHDGYCGTVACMAGHLALTAGLPPREFFDRREPLNIRPDLKVRKPFKQGCHVSEIVSELLGVKYGYAYDTLFCLSRWPLTFRQEYERNRAEGLALILEHMADVGGIDWEGLGSW